MHRYSRINFILVFGFFGGISALLDNAVEKTRDPGDVYACNVGNTTSWNA